MPVFGTQMFGSGAGKTAIAYSFMEGEGIQGNNTIFTFSDKDFGDADDSRVIVVAGGCAFSNVSGTVSSATIGGISATIIVQKVDSFGDVNDKQLAFIVAAAVPSGTSGDVVVTLSRSLNSSNRGMGIGVHRLTGPGVVAADDTATDDGNTCSGDTLVVSCNTKEDGAAIGSSAGNGGVYGSETWTGLTERARDYEGAAVWSSAGIATTSDESPRTMSVATNSYCTQSAVGASWHPA